MKGRALQIPLITKTLQGEYKDFGTRDVVSGVMHGNHGSHRVHRVSLAPSCSFGRETLSSLPRSTHSLESDIVLLTARLMNLIE